MGLLCMLNKMTYIKDLVLYVVYGKSLMNSS